ncbi:MAG: Calx-beta domain-containing protein, partial [Candidatus Promineifilaceae bacterium]|nr:Calx-beta domain-containing protein [Candidatus Promineifilaceae bacterium]
MKRSTIPKRTLTFLAGLALTVLVITGLTGLYPEQRDVHVVIAAPEQQPVVSFTRATDSVIEPDSGNTVQKEVTVQISGVPATGEEVTVEYTTANGSATAGVDYQATSGTLTFPVGSSASQTFNVTILGNNQNQPDRTFLVFLTNPVNATVGVPQSITITIVDNDTATPTHTPTGTPGGIVFLDQYEPNNVFETAYTTSANAAKLTDITLWPVGDVDIFQFYGKKGSTYQVFTTDLEAGLDTFLKLYDPNGNKIAENDDVDAVNNRSQLEVTVKENGFYFAHIINKDPTDPTNKTYAFGVDEILPPTPTPSPTRIGQLDSCEPNNTLGTACLIGTGATKSNMNFIPPEGTGTDND